MDMDLKMAESIIKSIFSRRNQVQTSVEMTSEKAEQGFPIQSLLFKHQFLRKTVLLRTYQRYQSMGNCQCHLKWKNLLISFRLSTIFTTSFIGAKETANELCFSIRPIVSICNKV
jgi:hypothetical protein